METLQLPPKKSELLPKSIARSSEVFKHRLKSLASPPTSIVVLPLKPQPELGQSCSTVATPTTVSELASNTSTAAAPVLPLSKIFISQKFHVSPSMPIDEKIRNVWKQQISDRLSGVLRCEISIGSCLQEFMMGGERPDALRPTLIISCGDSKVKKSVEKIFKRQQWLHELLKANQIMFVALVAKTHLSAEPAVNDKSILASSEFYTVQVEDSDLTTSCGLKLSISGADKGIQQHCTLGGLLMVDGKILGLTAGHPFRNIGQHLVEQDLTGAEQVADSPDDERSSSASSEPFVFNGDDDDDTNDDKTASTLSLPDNNEDWPIDSDGLTYNLPVQFDSYALSPMRQVSHPAIVPDSRPRQVSFVEDHPYDYDWHLLTCLSPTVTARPNEIAHVDLRHNNSISIEETISDVVSGDVIINTAMSLPQLGYLHSSPAKLQIDKSVFDVQLITLEHVLPLGSSGAWVLLGTKLCGYIIAVRQDIPWAYMVAIAPVMKDIGRKLKTDDVRLPTAAEIRSLTAPSKALTAGPPDILGKDDRNPILAGGQASVSEETPEVTWQAQDLLSHITTEMDSGLREVGELPKYDYSATESGYRIAVLDGSRAERVTTTSFEAGAEESLVSEKSKLSVQVEKEAVTEEPPMLPVASQPSVAPMAERTESQRELQRAVIEQTLSPTRTSIASQAGLIPIASLATHPVEDQGLHDAYRADVSPLSGDTQVSLEASDRLPRSSRLNQMISQPGRIWRALEANILRIEYQRRRNYKLDPLPYLRYVLLQPPWYYVRFTVYYGIMPPLYILYFIVFLPIILWITYRHRNVLVYPETLERQNGESIEMLGDLWV